MHFMASPTLPQIDATVAVALIALSSAIVTGYLAFRGKREETTATEIRELVKGQGERIEQLEGRLSTVENDLSSTREALRREQDTSQILRLALRRAVEWLRRQNEWAKGPQSGPSPEPPLEELESVLAMVTPTARLPPTL